MHRAAHVELVEVLGERHPRTLFAAAELGMSLAASGDAMEAQALLASTLAAQTEVLGIERPDTRRTAEALAALRAQGDGITAITNNGEQTPYTSHG